MSDSPEAFVRSDFLAWTPLFPGALLQERDRLNVPGLGSFTIDSFFTSGVTGIAGYVLVIEKVHLGQNLS
jgi:hypothetical protein